MPRVIVLGTGTNVGKSYVSRLLLRSLAALDGNARVLGLKPVETGIPDAPSVEAPNSDAALLASESRNVANPPTRPLYGFVEPLAPYLAAQRAGAAPVELERVVDWVRSVEHAAARGAPDDLWTVIETAGGAWSPIGPGLTNVDLWGALEPAVAVLVARDTLGTLHDITATLLSFGARDRRADHVVLSASSSPDLSTGTNAAVLEELGIARPWSVASGQQELQALAAAIRSP